MVTSTSEPEYPAMVIAPLLVVKVNWAFTTEGRVKINLCFPCGSNARILEWSPLCTFDISNITTSFFRRSILIAAEDSHVLIHVRQLAAFEIYTAEIDLRSQVGGRQRVGGFNNKV